MGHQVQPFSQKVMVTMATPRQQKTGYNAPSSTMSCFRDEIRLLCLYSSLAVLFGAVVMTTTRAFVAQ